MLNNMNCMQFKKDVQGKEMRKNDKHMTEMSYAILLLNAENKEFIIITETIESKLIVRFGIRNDESHTITVLFRYRADGERQQGCGIAAHHTIFVVQAPEPDRGRGRGTAV